MPGMGPEELAEESADGFRLRLALCHATRIPPGLPPDVDQMLKSSTKRRYAVVRGRRNADIFRPGRRCRSRHPPCGGQRRLQLITRGTPILRWPYDVARRLSGPAVLERHPAARAVGQSPRRTGVLRQRRAVSPQSGLDRRPVAPAHPWISRLCGWLARETSRGPMTTAGCWVTSRLEVWRRPEWMEQFPFAHDLVMTHRLADGRLSIDDDDRESQRLADARRNRVPPVFPPRRRAARQLGPLAARAATLGTVTTRSSRPARRCRPTPFMRIATRSGWTASRSTMSSRIWTGTSAGLATIVAQGQGRAIEITLGPRYRDARGHLRAAEARANDAPFICIEPMAAITNAFNLAHRGLYHDLQSVPAGGTWQETFSVKPSGF